jgi:cyclohexyl-isocyanide hydratase
VSPLTRHIALVAYPQFTALDLLGPHHVLSMLPGTKVHIVAASRAPVTSDLGLTVVPTMGFDECPADLTVLLLPGGTTGTLAAMQDPLLQAFVRDRGARAQWVCSVCTGSLVLAAAGLLKGYRATSHWATLPLLSLLGVTPVAERVVRDRNRLTGAGVTAGLDFGLTLVAELSDAAFAGKVQLLAEYDPEPPFDTGSPAKAGDTTTAEIRAHLSKFLAAAELAVLAASMHTH